jgi:hypothetical protein
MVRATRTRHCSLGGTMVAFHFFFFFFFFFFFSSERLGRLRLAVREGLTTRRSRVQIPLLVGCAPWTSWGRER